MPTMTGYGMMVFPTAIGPCGIAWGARGIVATQLPQANAELTLARLKGRCPDANARSPRAEIERAIDEIVALLSGDRRDLRHLVLDVDDIPEFERRVYSATREILPGATATYGEIAAQLGDPLLARDVGQALGRNPIPIIVPCHRVVAAGGKTGGFSGAGGVVTKLRLLTIEGAEPGGPTLFEHLPLQASARRHR